MSHDEVYLAYVADGGRENRTIFATEAGAKAHIEDEVEFDSEWSQHPFNSAITRYPNEDESVQGIVARKPIFSERSEVEA